MSKIKNILLCSLLTLAASGCSQSVADKYYFITTTISSVNIVNGVPVSEGRAPSDWVNFDGFETVKKEGKQVKAIKKSEATNHKITITLKGLIDSSNATTDHPVGSETPWEEEYDYTSYELSYHTVSKPTQEITIVTSSTAAQESSGVIIFGLTLLEDISLSFLTPIVVTEE